MGKRAQPPPNVTYSLGTVPILSGRKEGKTSSQHGPYALGYTHPTMAKNNELQASNSKLISEISPQFRLGAATRPHEVGISSNRGSEGRGEYVLGSCTHRPSRQQSWEWMKHLVRGSSPSLAMKLKS